MKLKEMTIADLNGLYAAIYRTLNNPHLNKTEREHVWDKLDLIQQEILSRWE